MEFVPYPRFWQRVKKSPECWEWTGCLNGTGYGAFRWKQRGWLAHRYSYTLHNGPIPAGQFVLHRCDNPKCIRPDHLWLGTQTENMKDCAAKGRNTRHYRWTTADNPNKGIPCPDWLRERVRQAKSRPFRVMGRAGEIITGTNLTHFCRVYDLNQGTMFSVIKGRIPHHKGYTKAPS